MSQLTYLVAYVAIVVFVLAVLQRFIGYLMNPIHVRWELYPVAHEEGERANYGGSYLEDVDWWNKPRHSSKINELKVMIPEILFLLAVWEHKRSLWYVTYPFHLGLYLIIACLALLGFGSILELFNLSDSVFAQALACLASIIGPIGFVLCIGGGVGLVLRRLSDPDLRKYSTNEHYLNLYLFILIMAVSLLTWLGVDSDFSMARTFIANLITLSPEPIDNPLFGLQIMTEGCKPLRTCPAKTIDSLVRVTYGKNR